MSPGSRKSAPSSRETPDALDPQLLGDLRRELQKRVAPQKLDVDGREGEDAAVVVAVVGKDTRAHEVFVFSRGPGALDRCIDWLDAALAELAADDDAVLPLDWEGRPFGADDQFVIVRGEVRNYVAEQQAAQLLGEQPAPRGLAGFLEERRG